MGKSNKNRQKGIEEEKKYKREERFEKKEMRKHANRVKYGDDQWKSDFRRFADQLAVHNLFIKDVAGDGNCLFRAVSDQLEGTAEKYDSYRQRCVDFIEQNGEDFAPFIDDGSPLPVYCTRMRKNAVWGGNIELQALSRLLTVNIVIHQLDAPRWEVNNWGGNARAIHLSYHSGQHYASVRPMGQFIGIPNHKELKPPTWLTTEIKNSADKKPSISTEEKIIMDSTQADIYTVKHFMHEMNNEMDAVIEFLITVRNAEEAEQTRYKKEMQLQDKQPSPASSTTSTTSTNSSASSSKVEIKVASPIVHSFPKSNVDNEKVKKLKSEIQALQQQESILMNMIVSVDSATAEDLQITLDVVSADISKLKDELAKHEKEEAFDQDALLAYQLMQEEEEKESQRQKSIEMAKQIQREQEQKDKEFIARFTSPSAGHENEWQTVSSKKNKKDRDEEDGSDDEKENKHKKQTKPNGNKKLSNKERKQLMKEEKENKRHEKVDRKREKEEEEELKEVKSLDLGSLSI